MYHKTTVSFSGVLSADHNDDRLVSSVTSCLFIHVAYLEQGNVKASNARAQRFKSSAGVPYMTEKLVKRKTYSVLEIIILCAEYGVLERSKCKEWYRHKTPRHQCLGKYN